MSQQNTKSKGASVTWYGPNSGREEPLDTMPHDSQPPGVDEDNEPQSLEEALAG